MEPRTEVWFFGTPDREIDIELVVPDLSRLEVDGAGVVDLDGLEGESLEVELDGAADVDGEDLDFDELAVVLSGVGSVRVEWSCGPPRYRHLGAGRVRRAASLRASRLR